MRIGITGGLGFIGSALGQEARQRGHEVVVYSRKAQPAPAWAVACRVMDPAGTPVLDVSGLDALVHLAGESVVGYWTEAKKQRIRESRVPVTQKVVEALRDAPGGDRPGVFVCASGSGAYGNRGDEVLTESSAVGDGFLADVCREWEAAAREAESIAGTRVVLLRTGMVLGEKGGAWPMLKKIFKMRLGSRLGDGRQWAPWIHLDDEVGIILHALESAGVRGPVNLGSPSPVTNAEMTSVIAATLKTTKFFPAPAFAMKLALGEFGSVVLDSQRMLPKVATESGYIFKYPDLRGAVSSLA